jgi:hypothetical protein
MDVGWSGHCLKLPSYNSLGMVESDGEETREFGGIVTGKAQNREFACEPPIPSNEPQSSVAGMKIGMVVA